MTREEYNKTPNICKHCGKEIICAETQRVSHILKRKYCSTDCFRKDKSVYNGSGIYYIKK